MSKRRERILTHACDLYLRVGFEGFSMRKLARDVGVTAPALYRHFENREEVLFDVLGEAHDELFRTLSRALSGATPLERFEIAGEAYMDFSLKNPRYFQMVHAFREFMGLEEVPAEVARRHYAIQQFWDDRVRECVEAEILRPEDPAGISLTLWSHAYGLLSLYSRRLLSISEDTFRAEFRASFRRVLLGVGTEKFSALITHEDTPMGAASGGHPTRSE